MIENPDRTSRIMMVREILQAMKPVIDSIPGPGVRQELSITNQHPVANLDINTVPMIERGHVQNVHRNGEFLVGDLHVRDAGLISEKPRSDSNGSTAIDKMDEE